MSLSSVQHQILLHLTPDLYVLQHTYDFFLRDDGRARADRKKAKVEQGEVRS